MKKLSVWAKYHVWPARLIITCSILLLSILGAVSGLLLSAIQIILPASALFLFVLLYVAGIILYPRKKEKNAWRRSYRQQKICDLLLAGASFLMVVYVSNHPRLILNYSYPFAPASANSASLPKDSSFKTYKSLGVFAAGMKDEHGKWLKWKERKKMLKEQVRAIKRSKEPSDSGKVALIVLSVLVALGLIYLIAALSCTISCGGSGVLAVIVLVAGTTVVVLLLITLIRKILGIKKKKDIKNMQPETGSK